MVKLTKIYTRTGDDGTTALGSNQRLPKDAPRIEAYGDVDEANAAIGLAIVAGRAAPPDSPDARIADVLCAIQHDLFDVGADLCIPRAPGEASGSKLRIQPSQTERLERTIDQFNAPLGTLTSFVLPGGSPLAAALHLARVITRRAERRVVTLARAEPEATNPETVTYLNRLSDLLFVLSRAANRKGPGDVLWVPGVNRSVPEGGGAAGSGGGKGASAASSARPPRSRSR